MGVGIRPRGIALFVLGFLLGALSLYYVLWRTGGLAPGHFASRTTADLAGATGPGMPPPLATIPIPQTTPTPFWIEGATRRTPMFSLAVTAIPTPAVRFFTTLEGRTLTMPVVGARTIDLRDSFGETRGFRRHEAIDILAPRGAPVVAADEGRVEKLFTVKPGAFHPPPKVDSAVLRLRPLAAPLVAPEDATRFRAFVSACFSRRRKQLRNVVMAVTGRSAEAVLEGLAALGLDPATRPETLPPASFVRLLRWSGQL